MGKSSTNNFERDKAYNRHVNLIFLTDSQNMHLTPILMENEGELKVDLDAARKVFGDPKLQGKKICIISISGDFRKGKSLLLNFFLRCLRKKDVCS